MQYLEIQFILDILNAALENRKEKMIPANLDWNLVFQILERQKLLGLALRGLEIEAIADRSLLQKWEGKAKQDLVREISTDYEREAVLAEFEKHGIRYLPLKGIVLKNYYPANGTRSMADNDILYGGDRKSLLKIMKALGYRAMPLERHHDVFHKKPIYNFEMHRRLSSSGEFDAYFADVWKRAVKDEDNHYGYHMEDEDFYIHMFVHAFCHYENGGCGVRFLTDTFVWRNVKCMDDDYIRGELRRLGILEFSVWMEHLTDLCFGANRVSLSEMERHDRSDILECFQGSAQGSQRKFVKNGIQKYGNSKKYLFRRIFPEYKEMLLYFPILEKYKFLFPVLWGKRFFRAIIFYFPKTVRELKLILSNKKMQENDV